MIQFSTADTKVTLKERTALKDLLVKLFKMERKPLTSLHYIFCSDDYLLKINREYLQHDYYTDIITFELADDPRRGIEGEIYISVDRVRENAGELGVSMKAELLRVIFHGALHLCGYRDKTGKDEVIMRKMEDKYLMMAGID